MSKPVTKMATPLDQARAARKANAAPRTESADVRFKRIANARLAPTVKSILRLGNLARTQPGPDAPKGTPAHKITPEEAAVILNALKKAVNSVEAQYSGAKSGTDVPRL